jgi:hypothetical protein
LDPASTEGAVWLARAYLLGPREDRNPRAAIAAIAPLSEQSTTPTRAALYLGVAQVSLGHDRDGLAILNRLSAEDESPVRDYYRAIALFRLGEAVPARESLKRARTAEQSKRLAESGDIASEECRLARIEAEAIAQSPPSSIRRPE